MVTQPILGKVADVYSFSNAYVVSDIIQGLALPFFIRARQQHAKADEMINSSGKIK